MRGSALLIGLVGLGLLVVVGLVASRASIDVVTAEVMRGAVAEIAPADSTASYSYDAAVQTMPADQSTTNDPMSQAASQWPTDGKARAEAMVDRITRVTDALNTVCGTDITVMMSETGRGGEATGTGIVRVDFSLLWRVSEDALAVLIAHEFAHEVLGHSKEIEFLRAQRTGPPTRMQQLREMERRADAFAGTVLASTDYNPRAFDELLALAMDTEWSDPLIRPYYPNQDRMKTVLEAYKAGLAQPGSSSDVP